MLVELHCEKFRKKKITFHKGLNVVLGDEKASNSIGKSILLLDLDFAFGGNSLLDHNSGVAKELGDHDYIFVFSFGGERHTFKRNTATPKLVHICDQNYQEVDELTIGELNRPLFAGG